MGDAFTPLFGDHRGTARHDPAPLAARRWWAEHAAEAPHLAQWLDDAFDDGFDRLHAVGINQVDWWLDASRTEPRARRRYRLDADAELEWLLLYWPQYLRCTESPTSVVGYLATTRPRGPENFR